LDSVHPPFNFRFEENDMPDEEERIDIGAELGASGKLDDQLLRDLKDVAKQEKTRNAVDTKKTAQSAANKKKLSMYLTIGAIAAVVFLIIAYFVMGRPGSRANVNNQTGPQRIPKTTIAAPVTNVPQSKPPTAPPQTNAPPPSGGQDAGGYQEPM